MSQQKDFLSNLNIDPEFAQEQQTGQPSDLDFWLTADFASLNDDGLTDDLAAAALKYPETIDLRGLLGQDVTPEQLFIPPNTQQDQWFHQTQLTSTDASVDPFLPLPPVQKRQSSESSNADSTSKKKKQMNPVEEEDKRRRNTAASARFRAKKKAKEEAIHRQAEELQQKVADLEAKVREQEMEITWLRKLVTDRDGAPRLDEIYREVFGLKQEWCHTTAYFSTKYT
ncbi:hypothetical protein EDD86DRAFT_119461 [Gorgonomyces haynaldii]|nr:hypothetical protein EDD86DRAFT_119461 [Gorgonomyces haynaldii]